MTRLEEVRAEVEEISREYGNPGIEPGIFELVVALRYCGYWTSGSCGGHYSDTYSRYPWVLITPTETQKGYLRPRGQKRYSKKFLTNWKEQIEHLNHLVSFFNSKRYDTAVCPSRYPQDEALVFEDPHNIHGPCFLMKLRPKGAEYLEGIPQELISKRQADSILKRYRRVMQEFAKLLIEEHDKK